MKRFLLVLNCFVCRLRPQSSQMLWAVMAASERCFVQNMFIHVSLPSAEGEYRRSVREK